MKKLIILICLLFPGIAFGAVTATWQASSTSQGWIFPALINGVQQTVVANNYIASSTTASSLFAGNFSNLGTFSAANGGLTVDGSGNTNVFGSLMTNGNLIALGLFRTGTITGNVGANPSSYTGAIETDTNGVANVNPFVIIGGNNDISGFIDDVPDWAWAIGANMPGNTGGHDLQFNTYDGSWADDMTILNTNGFVGIADTAPSYLLDVGSSDQPSGAVANFTNTNGNCTINPSLLGGIACISDATLKKNILPSSTSTIVSELLNLPVVSFDWLGQATSSLPEIGFRAQDVQAIAPNLVQTVTRTTTTNSKGKISTSNQQYLEVDYPGLIPYLVQGYQDQHTEIQTLQAQVQALQGHPAVGNAHDPAMSWWQKFVYFFFPWMNMQ